MPETEVLEYRVEQLEGAVGEIRSAVKSIDRSLQAVVRLEERHAETRESLGRAFDQIDKVDARVAAVERDMPGLREMRGIVMRGIIGVVSLVGLAILGLVVLR